MKQFSIVSLFLFILLPSLTFSQEILSNTTPDFLSQLQAAAAGNKIDQVREILRKSQGQPGFNQLIGEVLAEAKKLILKEDFDNAEKYLKIILSEDSENLEAQDIYVNLVKVKKDKQKREEQERIKKENEEKRVEAERSKNAEEKVRVEKETRVTNIGFNNFSFDIRLSPASMSFYQSQFYSYYYDEDVSHWLYGLSGKISAFFNHPFITAGVEGVIMQNLIAFDNKGAKPLYANVSIMAASPAFIVLPLYLRGGAGILSYSQFPGVTNVLYTSVLSPTAGLGIRNITFLDRKIEIQCYSDVLLASLQGNNMDFALSFGFTAVYRYLTVGVFSLYAGFDYDHILFIWKSKLEQAGAFQISAGVTIQ